MVDFRALPAAPPPWLLCHLQSGATLPSTEVSCGLDRFHGVFLVSQIAAIPVKKSRSWSPVPPQRNLQLQEFLAFEPFQPVSPPLEFSRFSTFSRPDKGLFFGCPERQGRICVWVACEGKSRARVHSAVCNVTATLVCARPSLEALLGGFQLFYPTSQQIQDQHTCLQLFNLTLPTDAAAFSDLLEEISG